MSLTPEQKSSKLFKKSLGAAETLLTRAYFEEPKLGNNNILTSQIWSEADSIPTTAPILSDGQSEGVVKYYDKLELTHIPGSTNLAYSDNNLKDTIPFNYDPAASYWYTLYKNDGSTQIYDGEGDWLVDTSAGVLTFYGILPSGVNESNPPKISFYQYIGDKGLVQSGATSGINVKDPVIAATTGQTDATYSDPLSGFTNLPSEVDGITSFSEGDRFLIKNQTIELENGIYEISGTTLVRSYDHDGIPIGEVGVNDYTFVLSGDTNIATSWVLGSTDATNPNKIYPGLDSQNWILFSSGLAYTADEQAIKLDGTTFSLDTDETSGSSGLYQSEDGLKLDTTITNAISGNTSGVTSLDTALSTELSTEISDRISGDTSLATAISGNTNDISILSGDTLDITTILSDGEVLGLEGGELTGFTYTDDITSLETEINNFSGITEQTAGSGLTFNSGNTSLNVNVDDYTIKIVNDELRTPETWIETDKTTTIISGSGETNIVLDFEPVGYVAAYINGIEYLVSPTTSSSVDRPFFFSTIPVQGSTLNYDADVTGFGLESETDLITVKYSYINIV